MTPVWYQGGNGVVRPPRTPAGRPRHWAGRAARRAHRVTRSSALVVAVPTAGVRDWLTRRLATDLGVAANVAMPYPGTFFTTAVGSDEEDDPWNVERLTWAVLAVLDEGVVDVPGLVPNDTTGAAGRPAPSQRFAIARRIADLFDRYATTRPEVLRQWHRGVCGDGTVRVTSVGGSSQPGDDVTVGGLPPSMRWQFDLWRRVRERIDSPSPAEILPERIQSLRNGSLVPTLPASVELFGVTTMSRAQLDVLEALAGLRDVHVSVLHPSVVAWLRTTPIDRADPTVRNRRGDAEVLVADRHPLLSSWGRQHAETAALVRGLPAPASRRNT